MTTTPEYEDLRLTDDSAADTDSAADELPDPPATPMTGPAIGLNRGQVASQVQQMTQNNNYYLAHRRLSVELNSETVRLTMETFVEREYRLNATADGPMNSHDAARLLDDNHRCLMLVAAVDSGRWTASIALLSHTGRQLHQLPADDDAQRLLPIGDFGWPAAEKPAAYLVMLPSGAERHSRLPEQLAAYRHETERRNARLVIVADRATWETVGNVPGYITVQVERPSPYVMLELLLQPHRERWDVEALLRDKRVTDVLVGATPGQVQRLYGRVVDAASDVLRQELDDPVPAIAEMAVSAYGNWDRELEVWFEENPDPRIRLFLIVLAFLDGEPAADVLEQTERLAASLGVSKEFQNSICGPGIRQLARMVGADVDDQWRIRFTKTAYGAAVLRFVHGDQSAEFRRQLWVWASALPLRRGAPHQGVAGKVAGAMCDTHLAMPRPNIPELRLLVHSWWRLSSLRPLVASLITDLALSLEAGSTIRARLLRWSEASVDSRVLSAVAAVCAGPFADAYPQAALTRLNRLADREIVDDDVVSAVAELWRREPHRSAVLRQIVGWVQTDGPRRGVGLRALAAITTTAPDVRMLFEGLAVDDGVRDGLIQGFGDLFVPPGPRGEFRQALKFWLTIAAEQQSYRTLITHLLIESGRRSGEDAGVSARYGVMYTLLFDWRPVLNEDEDTRARDFRSSLLEQLVQADPLTRPRRADPPMAA
ncbi:hypothetical protein [Actinoplanes xinjiangensis]|uniref:hypothetical protein n=1 Tax=Actinoplanes xinjiangensis TaxID=512350 RepID=UPI00344987F8